MPERVVFDTNVQISGLLWRGRPYQCLLTARSNIVQAIYCSERLDELVEKLRNKFKFSESNIRADVNNIQKYADQVEITGNVRVISADPEDDKFIECAMVGKAAFIVSGDHHLLVVEKYQNIQIISRRFFLK